MNGFVSVVCGGQRHHACRPLEWQCSCDCHQNDADASVASDLPPDSVSEDRPGSVADSSPSAGVHEGRAEGPTEPSSSDRYGRVAGEVDTAKRDDREGSLVS